MSFSCSMKRTDSPISTWDRIPVTRVSRTHTILHAHAETKQNFIRHYFVTYILSRDSQHGPEEEEEEEEEEFIIQTCIQNFQ